MAHADFTAMWTTAGTPITATMDRCRNAAGSRSITSMQMRRPPDAAIPARLRMTADTSVLPDFREADTRVVDIQVVVDGGNALL